MNKSNTASERARAMMAAVKAGLRQAMGDQGPKWYAGEMGGLVNNLLNKTDPDNEKNPSLYDVARILVLTTDPAPALRAFCGPVDFQAVAAPAGEEKDIHRLMTEAGRELGEVAAQVLAMEDPAGAGGASYTAAELDGLAGKLADLDTKGAEIIAEARRAAAGQPAASVVELGAHRKKEG